MVLIINKKKRSLKLVSSCRNTKTETGNELHSIVEKYYVEAFPFY